MKPTKAEIKKTLNRLKKMQPKIRHYTAFGDDNRAAIGAQIDVLEQNLGPDEIADKYDTHEVTSIYESALQAREWLDGEEDENLADDWQGLVEK